MSASLINFTTVISKLLIVFFGVGGTVHVYDTIHVDDSIHIYDTIHTYGTVHKKQWERSKNFGGVK